ncbi:hypothetical protein DFAR_490008 [Desulfarculales bacterium]
MAKIPFSNRDPMGRNDRDGSRALDEDNAQALVRLRRDLPITSVITLISEAESASCISKG